VEDGSAEARSYLKNPSSGRKKIAYKKGARMEGLENTDVKEGERWFAGEERKSHG